MATPNYQLWTLAPESVEERRKRLLQQMGLGSNRALPVVDSSVETTTSSSLHSLDNSAGRDVSLEDQQTNTTEDANSTQDSPQIVSTDVALANAATTCIHERQIDNPANHDGSLDLSRQHSHRRTDAFTDHPSFSRNHGDGDMQEIVHHLSQVSAGNDATETSLENEENEDVDLFCTIKNLDNGKEFVMNESGEGGDGNRLKEIGTGRQLTLEEFVMSVGHSPLVHELMRRESLEILGRRGDSELAFSDKSCSKPKKKGGWFHGIKVVANTVTGHKERKTNNDSSFIKSGSKRSTETDDNPPMDVAIFSPERTKVKQYGKSHKELSALYLTQEIQEHTGAIWSMKFTLDGQYLATAGEDCVIHIWKVAESEKGSLFAERSEERSVNPIPSVGSSLDLTLASSSAIDSDKKKKMRASGNNYINSDHALLPENMFSLSEKPVCSFHGHLEDVLDLSWSKSQFLLSSSMDKTVRLWHMSSNSCLKIFAHSDYVTCIQFNPVDDRYFLSGSLDSKVRIWSIQDHKVVDWSDIHEMVTAACYSPDGQATFVGTHKGSCRIYETSDNKLHQEKQINVLSKKNKSQPKKITGFQCAPGSSSEVLITSADSRIRIFDGVDLVHKFKGFRNTSSQIGACYGGDGKYVICASEDEQVFVWRHDIDTSCPGASKGNGITQSYESFPCRDVTIATAWPYNLRMDESLNDGSQNIEYDTTQTTLFPKIKAPSIPLLNLPPRLLQGFKSINSNKCEGFAVTTSRDVCNSTNTENLPHDPDSANNLTNDDKEIWAEENLAVVNKNSNVFNSGPLESTDGSSSSNSKPAQLNKPFAAAWGMVIVTAGVGGEIRAYQNLGLPLRV